MAKRYLGEQQDVVLFETFTAASFSKVMKRSSWIFSFFFPHFIKTWIRLRLVNKDVNQTVFCSSLYSWTRHGWSLGQSIAAWKMKENCVHCQRRSFKSCEIICQALQSINISVMRRRAPPPLLEMSGEPLDFFLKLQSTLKRSNQVSPTLPYRN